jgi:hypothetical protein
MRRDGTHTSRQTFEVPDLHLCHACGRPFVVPAAVLDVTGPDSYLVELECMNCGTVVVSSHGEQVLEDLDRELDRQSADMQAALQLWEVITFREQIDAFATALREGHLLPEDF